MEFKKQYIQDFHDSRNSEDEDEYGANIAPEPFEEYEENNEDEVNPDAEYFEAVYNVASVPYDNKRASDVYIDNPDDDKRKRLYFTKIYNRRNPTAKLMVTQRILGEVSNQMKKLHPYGNEITFDKIILQSDGTLLVEIWDTDTYYKHRIDNTFITIEDRDYTVEFDEVLR